MTDKNYKNATGLVRIAELLIALDCERFNEDYVTLLKQYHTMHGPGKRPMKKTLEEMQRRINQDCREDKPKDNHDIFIIDKNKNPDKLWSTGSNKTSFIYFPKTGQMLKSKKTHTEMLMDNLGKVNPNAFSSRKMNKVLKYLGRYPKRPESVYFLESRDADWKVFSKLLAKNLGYDIIGILSGHEGKFTDDVIVGRVATITEAGQGWRPSGGYVSTTGVSFWNKTSKPEMLKATKKLGDSEIEAIWLWQ